MSRRITLLIALFPLFAGAQTTVVIRCTKRAIYTGADSRVFKTTINRYTGRTDTVLQAMCKLHRVGNINFAVLGYFAQTAADMGIGICHKEQTIQLAVTGFIRRFGQLAADSLAAYRRYATTQFGGLQDGASISQAIFFGYEGGRRYIIQTTFYFRKISGERFTVGCNIDSSVRNFASGHTQYIQQMITNSKTWRKPAVKTIRRLIHIQARADSLYVGGPTDILKVTNNHSRWITRKKACAADE